MKYRTNFRRTELSKVVKRNAALGIIMKGISFAVNLILVPVSLAYLGAEGYGIWLTLSAIITWITLFDFGFSNGLRNKLSEALSKNKIKDAKYYISTNYIITGLISVVLILAFLLVNPLLDWTSIINTDAMQRDKLSLVVLVFFVLFSLNVFLGNINFVLLADQRTAFSNLISTVAGIISLVIIRYISSLGQTEDGMLYLMLATILPQTFMFIVVSIYLFATRYRLLIPSIKYFSSEKLKSLWRLGASFFLIQISYIIIFTTDNLIIAKLFSPEEVTPFSIAYRYFQVLSIVFGLMLAPFWSAFTSAIVNNDIEWIKRTISKALKFFWVFVAGVIVMFLVSEPVITMWVGENIDVSDQLKLFMMLFTIFTMFNTIYVSFINGSGKVKLQMYFGIIAAAINIPLSILLAKNLGFGVSGVVFATLLIQVAGAVWFPYQYKLIISGRAKGIWGK